jgi:hypothetical protein
VAYWAITQVVPNCFRVCKFSAPSMVKWKDSEFQPSLGYIVRLCLKTAKKRPKKKKITKKKSTDPVALYGINSRKT